MSGELLDLKGVELDKQIVQDLKFLWFQLRMPDLQSSQASDLSTLIMILEKRFKELQEIERKFNDVNK